MRDNAHQAIPRSGRLARNLNLSPGVLSERIAPLRQDTVYCYIVDTAEQPDDRLCQTGSGPNFQGDLITLASCKHQMRTYMSAESWKGVWIAGFTRRELKNRLFYLMRVTAAYASHRELWYPIPFRKRQRLRRRLTWTDLETSISPRASRVRLIVHWIITGPARIMSIVSLAIGAKISSMSLGMVADPRCLWEILITAFCGTGR